LQYLLFKNKVTIMKHLKLFENYKKEISISIVVDRIYPKLKEIIQNQTSIDELAKAIDKRWEGPYEDSYEVRNLISDALDEVGITFSYDELTNLITSKLKVWIGFCN